MDQIKHIIAVASGKGGVGKSTTAVNLALALRDTGASVGLLEGARPEQKDGKWLIPIEAHGLRTMSMGYLVSENTPMVWRGPMAGGALQQMLEQTWWGALDYLVIDMPPGTGDIQLTLSQKASVAGAVIVTTPQDIALLDARKGIEMFSKVGIPVLGIVENMALHVCSECGHIEHIFGAEGGQRIASEYGVPLLGSLPLALAIREQTDSGRPTVVSDPESANAAAYRQVAERVIAALAGGQVQGAPEIVISND